MGTTTTQKTMNKKTPPPTSRRERKKEKTRLDILAVALELFRKQGVDATTMEQIASEADIAKATLYNYFPVKEAIVSEHWRQKIREYQPRVVDLLQSAPDTRARLQTLFTEMMDYIEANRDIYAIYIRYRLQSLHEAHRNPDSRSGFQEVLYTVIGAGQEAGELRKDVNPLMMAGSLELYSLMVCLGWLAEPGKIALKASMMQTIDFFLDGAAPR